MIKLRKRGCFSNSNIYCLYYLMYFSVYNIKNNKMKFIYISLIALSFCVLLTEAKLNVTVSEQKDIEVIYAKLKSKNSAMSVSKLRSKYENEFKLCDENHNGYLSRKEFINCVHNNTNSFANLLPSFNNSNIAKHLRLHGIKSENDYINRLYDLFAPKTIKITFYIYMTIVLYNSSFDNCQNVPFFIYEKKFECLVDYVVPYKTLPHGTLKTLFDFGINLSPNREERYLDVPTFILLSLSIRLFGKVNIRNNYMVSKAEMNHAYDNGRLPIRYNKEMIDDIFDLVEGDEMNVHSFVFYDIILKIYKCYHSGRNNQMTLKEMTMSLKHIYFPRRYLELLKKKDVANKIIKKINKIKRKLSNSTEKERNSTKEEKNKTESLSILDLSFKMLSYKNEKKLYENIQCVSIECKDNIINLLSWINGWHGNRTNERETEFTISSTSSLEVIGAAVKYAIGNCRGKGADLIRSLLFPNGQPETFEKYIEELGIG